MSHLDEWNPHRRNFGIPREYHSPIPLGLGDPAFLARNIVSGFNDTDLQAYWTFERESGDTINRSESAETLGTAADFDNNTDVTYGVTGIIGNCVEFDTAGAELQVTNAGDIGDEMLSATAKWTLNFWLFAHTGTAGLDIIMDNSDSTGANDGFFIRWESGNTIRLGVNQSSVSIVGFVTTGTVSFNAWHMITITFDYSLGSDNCQFIIDDGTPETFDTGTLGAGGSADFPFTLGRAANGNDDDYDGLVDEFSWWKRVLTAAEITTLYNSGDAFSIYTPQFSPANISDGLAWFNFADKTKYGFDVGDLVDAMVNSLGSDAFDLVQDTDANQGTWIESAQNGNDVLRFASADFMASGNISAASQPLTIYWVAKTPAAQKAGVTAFLENNGGASIQCGIHGSASPNIMNNQWDADTMTSSAITGLLGAWHIFRLVVDGSSSSMEVDGVEVATGDLGTTALDDFRISDSVTTSTWDSDFGEIAFYGKVVSGAEKTSLDEYFQAKWDTPALP